jgi:hypothetical protein
MNKDLTDKLAEFKCNDKPIKSIIDLKCLLPEDYINFLQIYNGGSGFIGKNSYVYLWSVDEIDKYNKGYCVEEFIPEIILIGSSGSEIAYGVNKDGRFIEVPFIGMNYNEIKIVASNFNDFVNYLYYQ